MRNVITAPNAADIIGRAAHKPKVVVVIGRTGLAVERPIADLGSCSGTVLNNGLENFIHDRGGIGADNLRALLILLKNDISEGIVNDGIGRGSIIHTAVAEGGKSSRHFGDRNSVDRSAQSH